MSSGFFCLGLSAWGKSRGQEEFCACIQQKLIVLNEMKLSCSLCESKTRKNHFISKGRIYWVINMINIS